MAVDLGGLCRGHEYDQKTIYEIFKTLTKMRESFKKQTLGKCKILGNHLVRVLLVRFMISAQDAARKK